MIKSRVDLLFKNFPGNYPHHLERNCLRVLQKLMHLWAQPQFDAYLQDLLVNSRIPPRKGFPPEVVAELMFISKLHDSFRQQNLALPPLANPWETLPPDNQSPQSYIFALKRGDLEQVRIYLNGRVPVDYHFEDGGITPLGIAAMHDQAIIASLLIQSGANLNVCDKNLYMPLHWAAFFGHTTVASLLLKHGANIDAQERTGCTPLALAVVRNQTDIVSLLLRNGANAKLASTESGTPLDIATRKGLKEIAAMLKDTATR